MVLNGLLATFQFGGRVGGKRAGERSEGDRAGS